MITGAEQFGPCDYDRQGPSSGDHGHTLLLGLSVSEKFEQVVRCGDQVQLRINLFEGPGCQPCIWVGTHGV